MSPNSRRDFLKTGSATLLYGTAFLRGGRLEAQSLGLPLGLQLYSVRDVLPTNYEGTLKQISALGYREVESNGWLAVGHAPSSHSLHFYNRSATQVKQAMSNAGLRCVSAHFSYNQLHDQLDQVVAFSKVVGIRYAICSFPGLKNPSGSKNKSHGKNGPKFTLSDWRWNAEQINKLGEKISGTGVKFGYHNHWTEFQKVDGVVPYDEVLRLTDPSKVTMEMDCGWVVVGGGNPIEYLRRYPTRFSMLHVKDFKSIKTPPGMEYPPSTELGRGVIDYRPIFKEAAKTGHIKHCFVEQEDSDIPRMESLKVDAEYLRKLNA